MIRVEISDDEISAALDRLAQALTDMTPVMGEIGEALLASTQDRVLRGIDPEGAPFAPRSRATLDRYAKLDLSYGAVLNRSGEMRQQLSTAHGPDFVEIGSNAIQSAVMQFGAQKGAFGSMANGSPIPWGTIPPRPFLGISETDRTNIADIVDEWLERVAGSGA